MAQWLSRTTRLTAGEAGRRVRLATALAAHDQTRDAVAAGAVLPEQATVITTAVEALDEEYAAEAHRAEAYLIGEAAHFDAYRLRELGEKLVDVIDPDGADAHEAALLERQEAHARKKTEFRLSPAGDGLWRGSFTLPELQAQMLRKSLMALAQLLRLACEAKVLPAVLHKGGHVLDLGRTHRFHNAAQRLALIIEQKTCHHPACDTAGAFCHVHHHQTHATGQTYPLRT